MSLEDALDGCERILNDEFAKLPEQALYMIGAIAEVRQMKLTVRLPSRFCWRKRWMRIKAEAENGWFGLLPGMSIS